MYEQSSNLIAEAGVTNAGKRGDLAAALVPASTESSVNSNRIAGAKQWAHGMIAKTIKCSLLTRPRATLTGKEDPFDTMHILAENAESKKSPCGTTNCRPSPYED